MGLKGILAELGLTWKEKWACSPPGRVHFWANSASGFKGRFKALQSEYPLPEIILASPTVFFVSILQPAGKRGVAPGGASKPPTPDKISTKSPVNDPAVAKERHDADTSRVARRLREEEKEASAEEGERRVVIMIQGKREKKRKARNQSKIAKTLLAVLSAGIRNSTQTLT